jgi:hypothetical protein
MSKSWKDYMSKLWKDYIPKYRTNCQKTIAAAIKISALRP